MRRMVKKMVPQLVEIKRMKVKLRVGFRKCPPKSSTFSTVVLVPPLHPSTA